VKGVLIAASSTADRSRQCSSHQQEITMRCVFVGTGGFLGRIDSDTRCAFWAEEPVDHGFDPQRLITIDLARTPSAAAAGELSWDAGKVDDCFTGPNGNVKWPHPTRICYARSKD
jgi:hypothetical protein